MVSSGPSWFNPGNRMMGGQSIGPTARQQRPVRQQMNGMSGGVGFNSGGMKSNYSPQGPVSTAPTSSPVAKPMGLAPSPWKNGGMTPGYNFANPNNMAELFKYAVPNAPSPEYGQQAMGGNSGGMVAANAPAQPYGDDGRVNMPYGNPMDELVRRSNGNTGVTGGINKGIFSRNVQSF